MIGIVWLLYLCVSQHIVQLTIALRAPPRGTSAGESRDAHSKCPKPSTGSHQALCDWYLCEHLRKRKLIERAKKRSVEEKWYRPKTFVKYSVTRIFKAYKLAVRGAEEQCDPWGATIGDDFLTWAEALMPEARGCIRVALQLQSGLSESKCKEVRTHQFKKRLMSACSARYKAPAQKARDRKMKIKRGIAIGFGAVAAVVFLPATLGVLSAALLEKACEKYFLKKPRLGVQSIFGEPKGDTDRPPQWNLPAGGAQGHRKRLVDNAGPNIVLQEQQESFTVEDFDEITVKLTEPNVVDDLISLGEDEPDPEDLYTLNTDAVAPPESTETVPSWQIVPRADGVAPPDGTAPPWALAASSAPWPPFASTNPFAAEGGQWQHAAPPAHGPMAAPTSPWLQATPGAHGPVAASTNPWQQAAAVQRQPLPAAVSRDGFPAAAGTGLRRGTEQPKGEDFFSDLVSFA